MASLLCCSHAVSSLLRTIGLIAEAEIVKLLLRINTNYSLKFLITWRLATIFVAICSRKDKPLHLYAQNKLLCKSVHDAVFIYRSLVCKLNICTSYSNAIWMKNSGFLADFYHYTILASSWSVLEWKQVSMIPILSFPSCCLCNAELALQATAPALCVHNPGCWKKAGDATTVPLL